MKRCELDSVGIYIATPFPGTSFYRQCVEKGYLELAEDEDFLDFTVYEALIDIPTFSRQELQEWRQYLYDTFAEHRPVKVSMELIKRTQRRPTRELLDRLEREYFQPLAAGS